MIPTDTDTAQTYRRRATVCTAMQVTRDNLAEVAAWAGGHLWAGQVVIPFSNGHGEMVADVGDWVVLIDGKPSIWNAKYFQREWVRP